MPKLPEQIAQIIEKEYQFPDKILIGQVATLCSEGPWVRSLRVYGIEDKLGLIFLTHNGSRKWKQLEARGVLSLCLVHPEYAYQLSARCQVQVLSQNGNEELFQKYWKMVRDDVKATYYEKSPSSFESVPQTLGIIVAIPEYWESLHLENDYPQSQRYTYEKQKDRWHETRIPLH
uniref:Pyridoxamine 5'-phosphate oxidase N-terminal domain-containing protein n=1 Tax=uncultured bacterium Ak20-3 TaxID=798570 RepID=D9MX77_9BACT|nr:hypothetical protein AKSOIL_0346 [uncultured bacterium Ak20-3]